MPAHSVSSGLVRQEQGFDVFSLQNEAIEISVVPQLGAKVFSIINRKTGRQWMSWPTRELKLSTNRPGDEFSTSTMVGWDECIPTIAACSWKNRPLADHGEVWSIPWSIDTGAFARGEILTNVTMPVSPFYFERGIKLHRNQILLHYKLKNLSAESEAFLWAMHPLLPTYPGDRFELTAEARQLLHNPAWLDTLDFGDAQPACAKTYAGPLREGRASIYNPQSGDRLTYLWDTSLNSTLGVWITRGGWNRLHHLALEPSNGCPDALSDAVGAGNRCGHIPPNATLQWNVTIQLDPSGDI